VREPQALDLQGASSTSEGKAFRFAGLVLDLDAGALARESGEAIPLTRGERALLRMFVARPGRVISRDTLLDAFANRRFEPFDRSVDVLIGKLRRKIESDPKRPRLIVTVSGEGYRFDGLRFTSPQIAKLADADGTAKREGMLIAARASEGAPPPAEAASRAAERRHITALAAELVWAEAANSNDPEDLRGVIDTFRRLAGEALGRYGSEIGECRGREIAAYFGHRQAQENDAERAVRAALAIQRALSEANAHNAGGRAPQFAARIGLDSGLVVVEVMGEVFGDAPNIATRAQALAEPGTVLITARVERQVAGLFVTEDRGAHALKCAPEPTTLFRIVRARGGRRFGSQVLTPLVGREEEIELLLRRWERAVRGEGQVALVVGEPGIGKSRLVEEFRLRLGETPNTFVEWSSSQLLQNTPLHPIAEWGRQRFGGAETPVRQRLGDLENTLRLIGLDPAEYVALLAPLVEIPLPEERAANLAPEELRRRQLAAIVAWLMAWARTQAIVLAFEDLQWADPTSIDLVRALAERGAQAPLLLLATSRPEFRPPWSLRPHHGVVSLGPLDQAQALQMVSGLASRHAFSKEVIDGVNERTGGVPLFIEEVARLLLERGERGGAQAIPLTLQQSLAARLDRLGEAREAAQIGAVLGRSFSYALLSDVAAVSSVGGVADPALQTALERLAEADILFVEGAGPQTNYRFKHALIQDAAYDSLLRSRRQALHRRAAEILVGQPERAAAEPEAIAHHFTEAGLDELAIEWWGKAGDQALRRSAFQEAVAHLGKAIAIADKAGPGSAPRAVGATASQRLKLQASLSQAMMYSRGVSSEESKTAFAHAQALAAGVENAKERFDAYYGLFAGSLFRGELSLARETAVSFLHDAEDEGWMTEAAVARRNLGMARLFEGDFVDAEKNLAEVLITYDSERDRDARFRFGVDTGAGAAVYLALASWALGGVERAGALSEEALTRANETGHAPTRANAHYYLSLYHALRGVPETALRTAKIVVDLSREHGLATYLGGGEVHTNWARARLGDRESRATGLKQALAAYLGQRNKLHAPIFQGLMAEIEAEGDDADGAMRRVDEALALANETGAHWTDALLHRIRGEILLKREPANPAPAEEAFQTAIAIAKEQGARSYVLLVSLSLAKLYRSTGRLVEAHAALAPALEGFSATPEMPTIAEARTLLAALAETEQVRADAARRQQRRHLQVAYGNALFHARGYGAPEAAEAFVRARESAVDDKGASERLKIDYALWAGNFARGELPSMRAHAAAFLRDVSHRPDSPEAGVAHRCAGTTHVFAGEYQEARVHLEQALALFQPGRDDDLADRFGQDAGVSAMFYLALVLGPMGDAGRAISLVRDAKARTATLTHIGARAYGMCLAAIFELVCGNLSRAAPHAAELAGLAHEHDLLMWRAYGIFLEGAAKAEGRTLGSGLRDMRRGAELLREQKVRTFDGLANITLAEAEARVGDIDRALAVLDETLATSEHIGNRQFDAELHRVRGEMLLKRDPANPPAAEEAFLTAIAVSKQQSTRSFELRAALSLARLYQSTGRPVEGHAVLAPPLEGFAATPEMPEIAEAEALLSRLT
jgi:class 3 adenylate cyclase/predicted ATPase